MQMKQPIILLAEDDEDDIALVQHSFETHHIANHLAVVRDGQEALDYIFAEGNYRHIPFEDKPQVLLLDLGLPVVPGLAVLDRIRNDPRTEYMPVIILTSSVNQEDIINSYQHGANSVVRKPLDLRSFMQATKQLGMYWVTLNQLPDQWLKSGSD